MAKAAAVLVVFLSSLFAVRSSFAMSGSGSVGPPSPSSGLLPCLQGTGVRVVTQASDAASFDTDRQVWNEKIQRNPAVIAYANVADQVQQVVRCGRQNNVQVSPRSGGHSYEGYSVEDGTVLLDISGLDSLQVLDADHAVIGAGIKLGPLYLGLYQNGNRAFPAGVCPGVGAGGHLAGGGVGMLGRQYGLASDQIVALDMVDASGNLITADASNNSDLLFASQGGGGGSLGIVTSFTIKTYPAPAVTTIYQVNWDLNDLEPVMTWWQKQAPSWPNELSSDFMAFSSNAQIAGNFAGSKADLMAILNSTGYQSLPSKQSEDFREMPYINAALYNAVQSQGLKPADDINSLGLGPGTSLSPRGYFKAKSQIVTAPVSAAGIRSIKDAFADQRGQGYWQAHAQGGAIGAVPNDATAYSHRDAIMIIQLMATWTDPSKQDSAQGWLNNLYTSTLPYVASDAAYLNYIDADQADWAQAYFGSNLPRLQQVKAKYDPDNYWDKPQGKPIAASIQPAAASHFDMAEFEPSHWLQSTRERELKVRPRSQLG
ncbi:hypothetical protein WJX74_003088 [Apatococcus lobatus]|uniref:FAD-binding PCMH-type domain-containing protein n=1 Tax=Apatococcus lobatus TaxID=904363 RepID=A0AAW1R244_9CHLO